MCYAVVIAGTLDLGNERGQALGRTLLGNAMSALDEMGAFRVRIPASLERGSQDQPGAKGMIEIRTSARYGPFRGRRVGRNCGTSTAC